MFRCPLALIAVTVVMSLSAPAWAVDLIFQDGFESGDLSAWSSSATDFGDLSVTGAAALASTSFGLQALVNDTNGINVRDDSPNDESRYRVRFYFEPNGFDPGEGDGHLRVRLLLAFDVLNQRVITIVLRRLSGAYAVRGRVRLDDATRADTAFIPVTDAPHAIEFDWQRSTSPGGNNGSFELWIDGVSQATLTALNNNSSTIDYVRLGPASIKTGAAGTIFFDEFVSRRVSFIGLLNGTACSSPAECTSGFCVDGFCCNSACGGGCEVCNANGAEGTCTNLPAGSVGVGCGNYFCDGASGSCPTSCSANGQCTTNICSGNICQNTCFPAGSPVATADGLRAIETIAPGDRVLSFDRFSGERAYRRVQAIERKKATEIVSVSLAGGSRISMTPEHYVWVEGSEWVRAYEIAAGDALRGADGGTMIVEAVAREPVDDIDVYNLVVEGPGTYYVGSAPVLVNTCTFRGFSDLTAGSLPHD